MNAFLIFLIRNGFTLVNPLCCACILLIAGVVTAQEPEPEPQADEPVAEGEVAESEPPPPSQAPAAEIDLDAAAIPVPFPVTRYETAWTKNPFLRKTVTIAAPQENFGKDWALSGMADIGGKIRITLINKQTGEYKRVTNQDPPDAEFKLVKANFSKSRADQSVEIQKGTEVATLKHDESIVSRPITVNNTQMAAPSGQPGQPPNAGAVRPGQPVTAARGGVQAVVAQPGAAPVQAGVQPMANTPRPPSAPQPPSTPPTISRRRQLVPAPVIPPQQ